jgi:hypothetical protein
MAYVGIAAVDCLPLTWLARLVSDARQSARVAQCTCNLGQIGLALHNYQSTYGCFPPAFVADAEGRQLYSWRVLLMAELDRVEGWFGGQLVGGFHFDEPWDSPNNSKLHSLALGSVLQCAGDRAVSDPTETNYVAVIGPGTIFPSDGTSRRLADMTDAPADTLIVVEVAACGIHWMEPKELDWTTMSFQLNDRGRPSVSSNHWFWQMGNVGPHAITGDFTVTTLAHDLAPATLRALLTIAGAERLEPTSWRTRP